MRKIQLKLSSLSLLLVAIIFLNLSPSSAFFQGINFTTFSTYFGGEMEDLGRSIAVDNRGDIIVVGHTKSSNIAHGSPTLYNFSRGEDVLIAKFSSNGKNLIFYTYFGGVGQDNADGVIIDNDNNIIVTGYTSSIDFPTKNALYSNYSGGDHDLFVLKLTPNGDSIIFSTYFGGTGDDTNFGHHGNGVCLDSNDNIYFTATTTSLDIPLYHPHSSDFSGGSDILMGGISSDGQNLLFSSYYGGSGNDFAGNCQMSSSGVLYFAGSTTSSNFPLVDEIQSDYRGETDSFLAILDLNKNETLFSSYYGGFQMEYGGRIALDSLDNVILIGTSKSVGLIIENAFQPTKNGGLDAYIAKFSNQSHQLIFSTYLGGTSHEWGFNVAIDKSDNINIIGQTSSDNFPTKIPFQKSFGGGWDGFAAKISSEGKLLMSSYFGGSGIDFGFDVTCDLKNKVDFIFFTESNDISTSHAIQSTINASSEFFLLQLKFSYFWLIFVSIIFGISIIGFIYAKKRNLIKFNFKKK